MQWLDRTLLVSSHYFCLCLTEADFRKAVRHLRIPVNKTPDWMKYDHSDATVHYFQCDGKHAAIVCLRGWEGKDPIAIAGLLVHEAVHIWQETCDNLGDLSSRETEAYAIQNLSQQLMWSFVEQTKGK